jgi:hypothetical protein
MFKKYFGHSGFSVRALKLSRSYDCRSLLCKRGVSELQQGMPGEWSYKKAKLILEQALEFPEAE